MQQLLVRLVCLSFVWRLNSFSRGRYHRYSPHTLGPCMIYGHLHYTVKYDKNPRRQLLTVSMNYFIYCPFIKAGQPPSIKVMRETKQKTTVINRLHLNQDCTTLKKGSMRKTRPHHISSADISTISLQFSWAARWHFCAFNRFSSKWILLLNQCVYFKNIFTLLNSFFHPPEQRNPFRVHPSIGE